MGGGRLWEVVAYGRWSLMGGGRLWEVVGGRDQRLNCILRSTLLLRILKPNL